MIKKSKRFFPSVLLLLALFLGLTVTAGAADTSSHFLDEVTDAPSGYTEIATAADLYNIRSNLSGNYVLTADIDLSGYASWTPIGLTYAAPFTGKLDGNGHVIRNLTITSPTLASGQVGVGLFGYTKDATIENLGLENVNININANYPASVGGIVGYMHSYAGGSSYGYTSGLYNCYVTGSIAVNTPVFTTAVAFSTNVGGLVGYAHGDTAARNLEWSNVVQYSYNTASVTSTGGNPTCVGGIIGLAESKNSSPNWLNAQLGVLNCFNSGSISATVYSNKAISAAVGGLVGETCMYLAQIQNSYNSGNVSAYDRDLYSGVISGETEVSAGGLVGRNRYAVIQAVQCYSDAAITAVDERYNGYAGGLVGMSDYLCAIDTCYAAGKVKASGGYPDGTPYAGGLIGGGPGIGTSSTYSYDTTVVDSFVLCDSISGGSAAAVYGGTSAKTSFQNVLALDTLTAVNDATGTITAAQAAQQSTYEATGWNFSDGWQFLEEKISPTLAWERVMSPFLLGSPIIVNQSNDDQSAAPNTGNTLFADVSALTTDQGAIDLDTLSYQWLRNGVEISGATGNTYTLTVDDASARISVRVTVGDLGNITSAQSSSVTNFLALSGEIKILPENPKLGDVLRVDLSGLTSNRGKITANMVTYRWSDASTESTALARSVGDTYTVTVTAAVDGETAAMTSAPTASVTVADFSKGSGTESDPYLIEDLGDWVLMAYLCSNDIDYPPAHYKLMADLSFPFPCPCVSTFSGVFDGNGHSLSQVFTATPLFGTVLGGAVIKDLRVETVLNGTTASGGLIKTMTDSTVSGCTVSGPVKTAAIVVTAVDSTIEDCRSYAEIAASTSGVAGVVLSATNCTITNCRNYGTFDEDGTKSSVGGVVGTAGSCTMNGLLNYSAINCVNSTSIGGVVQLMEGGTLVNSHNYGALYNHSHMGGIVCILRGGTVSACENRGSITAEQLLDYGGGIVGQTNSGINYIYNCINYGNILISKHSFDSYAGGIVGYVYSTTEVKNCAALGSIEFRNAGWDSYGGGVTGYVDAKLTVYNFYTTSSATATVSQYGKPSYRHVGYLYGGYNNTYVNQLSSIFTKCYAPGSITLNYDYSYCIETGVYAMCKQAFADTLNANIEGMEGLLPWTWEAGKNILMNSSSSYPFLIDHEPEIIYADGYGVEFSNLNLTRSTSWATLYVAAYSPEGRMLHMDMLKYQLTFPNTFSFSEKVDLYSGCTVKAFLILQDGYVPYCDALTYTIP